MTATTKVGSKTTTAPKPRRRKGFPYSGQHDHSHPVIAEAVDDRTLGERVADTVARFGGSWPFIFCFLALIVAWMVLNTVVLDDALHHRPFDPFPYIALNLVLSALAGLQAPIIMMSQNRASVRDESLAAHHYDETQALDELLMKNTELTEQIQQLTKQIHEMLVQTQR